MISRNNYIVENVKNQEKINFKILLITPNDNYALLLNKYNNITKTYKMVMFNDTNLDFHINVDYIRNFNDTKYSYDVIMYLFDSKNIQDMEHVKSVYNKHFMDSNYDYIHYFVSVNNDDVLNENEYIKQLVKKEKHYFYGPGIESNMDRLIMIVVNKYILDISKHIIKYYDEKYNSDIIIGFLKYELTKKRQLNHIKTLTETNQKLKSIEQKNKMEGELIKKYEVQIKELTCEKEEILKTNNNMTNELKERCTEINIIKGQMDIINKQINIIKKENIEKDTIINNQKENIIQITNNMNTEILKINNNMANELKEQCAKMNIIREQLDFIQRDNVEKDNIINNQKENIIQITSDMDRENTELEIYKNKYYELCKHICTQLELAKSSDNPITVIDEYVDYHIYRVEELDNKLIELDSKLKEINQSVTEKNGIIFELRNELEKMAKEKDNAIAELDIKLMEALEKSRLLDNLNNSNENEKDKQVKGLTNELEKYKENDENYSNIFNMILLKNFYE